MTEFIRRNRIFIIVSTFVLAGLSLILLPSIQFEFDFAKFLAQDGEDVVFLKKHQKTFGNNNNFLVIAAVNEPSVFDTAFLKKVEKFHKSLWQFK